MVYRPKRCASGQFAMETSLSAMSDLLNQLAKSVGSLYGNDTAPMLSAEYGATEPLH